MDELAAAQAAYDGLTLQLLDGATVRFPDLSVAEAFQLTRELKETESDYSLHFRFVEAWAPRIGLADVPCSSVAFDHSGLEALDLEGVTVAEGLELAELLAYAQAGDAGSGADFLDRIPLASGSSAGSVAAGSAFQVGERFALSLYEHLYGLVRDFWFHRARTPARTVMILKTGTPTSSRAVSTT